MNFSRPSFPLVSSDAEAFEVLKEGNLAEESGVLSGRPFLELRSRTSLTLPLVGPMGDQIADAGGNISGLLGLSARSVLGRLGIEVEPISDGSTVIGANSLETSHRLIAAGAGSEPVLDVIKAIVSRSKGALALGRHILLPEAALTRQEVITHNGQWFLLPKNAFVGEDGLVSIPINEASHPVRARVLRAPSRIEEILSRHKFGLDQEQRRHPGLPPIFPSGAVLISDIHVSLGAVSAVVSGQGGVRHLAPFYLDPIRSSGLGVPRHVELLNASGQALEPHGLSVNLAFYPVDEITRSVARRLLPDHRAHEEGVHIEDVLEVQSPRLIEALMDGVSGTPTEGGIYARLLAPGRVAEFKWPDPEQVGYIDDDLCEETPKLLNGASGVEDRLVPLDPYESVLDAVSYVGGSLAQKNIVSLDTLPRPEVLRSLTKSGVGTFFFRHLGVNESFNVNRDAFVELCTLSKKGVRFFLILPDQSVRVFHNETWVEPKMRERVDNAHTAVVFYGSSVTGTFEHLEPEFDAFFAGLAAMPELDYGEGVAEMDGNGPAIMEMASRTARANGIVTIGIGTDLAAVEQDGSRRPDAWITFTQEARANCRQDLMERRAAFRIINVGGFGTGEELFNTLTNKKVLNGLPIPVILLDPQAQKRAEHFWEPTKVQIAKFRAEGTVDDKSAWVSECLHFVDSPAAALEVIQDFVRDPAVYWRRIGVAPEKVKAAFASCEQISRTSGFKIPPYLAKAVASL